LLTLLARVSSVPTAVDVRVEAIVEATLLVLNVKRLG